MELEVGMYVRTKNDKAVGNGIIGKIKYINEREFKGKFKKYYSVWTNNKEWFEILENDAISERVKASHNIIDLIEVGDYVNGIKIDRVDKPCKLNPYGSLKYHQNEYCDYENILGSEIKTIVTKEQFESMSYKVGE